MIGQDTATQEPTVEPAATQEPTQTVNYDEQLKKMNETITQLKSAQSGSDRMVTELRKENDELKKAQMTDKERSEYEKKLAEQDRHSLEREKQELAKERLKFKFIADAGVDSQIAEFLNADSEDGLKEQVAKIQSVIDKQVKPLQEKVAKLEAELGRPGGGTGTSTINWKTATVDQINSEYLKIKSEQGDHAAKAWLQSTKN
jgi:hypothetical protein